MNFDSLDIIMAAEKLARKEITSVDLTQHFIAVIEKKNPEINAFITLCFDEALAQAEASDARRMKGESLGILDGIPLGIKDVICTKGIRTTAASNMLKNFIPPYDATCIKKLKSAGVVILGKTNTDEFAMGASTETSAFGRTKNPTDFARVAGGSSGGSAAAVASGMCLGAIGTDTGGSIRQPAAFCGVVGMKVTYGRVSRYGVIPMASSFDTIGAFAKTTSDTEILIQAMSGKDSLDNTSYPSDFETSNRFDKNLKGLRIGIPREYFPENLFRANP